MTDGPRNKGINGRVNGHSLRPQRGMKKTGPERVRTPKDETSKMLNPRVFWLIFFEGMDRLGRHWFDSNNRTTSRTFIPVFHDSRPNDVKPLVRQRGSHGAVRHPVKPIVVTVPGNWNDDLPIGTFKSILRKAEISER